MTSMLEYLNSKEYRDVSCDVDLDQPIFDAEPSKVLINLIEWFAISIHVNANRSLLKSFIHSVLTNFQLVSATRIRYPDISR